MNTWREHARPIIAAVIRGNPGADKETLKKLIRAAYCFGEREFWPYKIWCSEVRRQLGEETPKERAKRLSPPRVTDTETMGLFDE